MTHDRVQFPDFRIEYERPDGRRDVEDVEVTTLNYRGAHAAGKVQAGFTRFRGSRPPASAAPGRAAEPPLVDPRVRRSPWMTFGRARGQRCGCTGSRTAIRLPGDGDAPCGSLSRPALLHVRRTGLGPEDA